MKVNFEIAKSLINLNAKRKVEIKEIWIDYGAELKDLNLVVDFDWCRVQLLCPRDIELAKKGELPIEEVERIIKYINEKE